MNYEVEDSHADLRFGTGAALELDRELYLNINGQLASLAVESARRIRPEDQSLGRLVVRFVVPNSHRLMSLTIPDDETQSVVATTYPS
jgi:hypothetical protein